MLGTCVGLHHPCYGVYGEAVQVVSYFVINIFLKNLELNIPFSLLSSVEEDNQRMLVVNSQGDTEVDSLRSVLEEFYFLKMK